MRTALVTGSNGRVGTRVVETLERAGWNARPFDLATGQDLRDAEQVDAAVRGCDAVVHAGAIAHDTAGSPADIVETNVLGTWHVLLAAELHRVARVIYFSSAQVFGCAEGEGSPAYLPIDDAHPLRASRPYGMSKRLAEEMCEAWTSRTGIPTLVLRPVMILDDTNLEVVTETDAELGAFVHVDDVADVVVQALQVCPTGHHRVTVCGPGDFDTSAARRLLEWSPQRTWPGRP